MDMDIIKKSIKLGKLICGFGSVLNENLIPFITFRKSEHIKNAVKLIIKGDIDSLHDAIMEIYKEIKIINNRAY